MTKWSIKITGSFPVSVNHMYGYRKSKTGIGKYLTPKARDFKTMLQEKYKSEINLPPIKAHEKISARLELLINDKRKHDIDNSTKSLLDAFNSLAWEDDNQIVSLHITKTLGCKEKGFIFSCETTEE